MKHSVLICCLFAAGCFPPPNTGGDRVLPPEPGVSYSRLGADSLKAYGSELARAHRDGAAKLRSGEIQEADKLREFMLRETGTAKEAAFAPIYRQANQDFGGSNWSPLKAAESYEQLATGFESGGR